MIQRKQTLFLLGVVIISILMFFTPFMIMAIDTHNEPLNLSYAFKKGYENTNIYYPLILNFLLLFLSITVIFLFKNRVLQFKLANLAALLSVFVTGLFFILSYDVAFGTFKSYSFGAFLPIIGAVLAYLGAHFIKKDEQMVRNADRIR